MSTSTSPKLELPPRGRSGGSGGRFGMVYLLLVVLVGLQGWSMFAWREGGVAEPAVGRGTVEAEALREVAMKLEDRNLSLAAAEAWSEYVEAASLSPREEAAIRYRAGKQLQRGEEYERAVAEFYRAEELLGEDAGDLEREVTLRVRECFQALGRFSDLSRELSARADVSSGGGALRDRQVVAQIGDEKITVSDFDRMLTEQVERTVAMQVGMGAEEADALRRRAHGQFADPQAKAMKLQELVASRVLAEEGRRRGLEKSEGFRRQVADFADQMLATRLLLDEVAKRGTVTSADVERYYAANKEQYAEPARVTIAQVLCDTREEAEEVIAEAKGRAYFGELAKEYSKDGATARGGGVIERPVVEGTSFVPGVGRHEELHAAVMGGAVDAVLAEPFESDRGWHVVKIVERKPRRQKALDEVQEAVRRDTLDARRAEVTEQFVRELFDSRGVKLYPSAFVEMPSQSEEETGG